MISNEIKEFAKTLVKKVRDQSIGQCDILLNPEAKGPSAKRWQAAIQGGSIPELLNTVIPDCIDTAIFYLLCAIDDGSLNMTYKSHHGKAINLSENGELSGYYAGMNWIIDYSSERYVDDFKDLDNFFSEK